MPSVDQKLKGKRALVTGASRGVGFGIAKSFAAQGAEVIATARSEAGLERLRKEIEANGGKVVTIPGDLATRSGAREVARLCGDVDILVNNAALANQEPESLLSQSDELWDRELAINLIAPTVLIQSLVPGMIRRGGGSIINISSVAAKRPDPGRSSYAASKAALEAMSRASAVEFAPEQVRVNVVQLGVTETEALYELLPPGVTKEQMGHVHVPIGRVADVSEVAATCLLLAGDEATSITGAVITVDGGSTAGTFMMRGIQKI